MRCCSTMWEVTAECIRFEVRKGKMSYGEKAVGGAIAKSSSNP
jgi:hypothetical protein